MAKVTIFDVAKRAGVSPATVSRVMNDGVCKHETKQKVLNAIKELDFVPNQSARNLGSVNSSKRIAIIIPNVNSYSFNQILDGIKDVSQIYGFDFNVFTFKDQKEFEYITVQVNNSSEYLGVIEISKVTNLFDKKIVSIFDQLFNIEFQHPISSKRCFIDVGNDILLDVLTNIIFKDINTVSKCSEADCIIVESIEEASKYLYEKVKQDIYVIEPCANTAKLLDINHLQIDMYSIGVVLIRNIIKQISNKKDNKQVVIKI